MSRYIDADALVGHMESEYRKWGEEYDAYQILSDIEDFPSADVVEVRHGHWECEEVQCVFGKKFILTCSECGESVSVTEEALLQEHYCRSCGARMDGKERENEQ